MKIFITAFALIAGLALALQTDLNTVANDDPWSGYQNMSLDSFKNTLLTDTENVWVVAFVTSTCSMCVELAPIWGEI